MGLVSVTLNGRPYDIACDDGQEGHVAYLADVLNSRVTALAETVGQVGESRLLLLAGLLVADELVEARNTLDQIARGGGAGGELARRLHRQRAERGGACRDDQRPRAADRGDCREAEVRID